MGTVYRTSVFSSPSGKSTAKMIRTAVLGVVAVLAWAAAGLPDYGASPGYIKVELATSYGPPKEPACYPKYVTKTMTKDVQGTEGHYATVTKEVPTTQYAYITETLVAAKTIIQYSTMTAYAEPAILTETESYPMTNVVTNTGYETKAYYVTQTKVQQQYVTMTVKNPYYVTQYETEQKQEYVYNTVTQNVNEYVTMTVYTTVPEYHTVSTMCTTSSTMMYGYGY